MSEAHILSSEEVDALLKASQSTAKLADQISKESDPSKGPINNKTLSNVIENTRMELEKTLITIFRKKIAVKTKPPQPILQGDFVNAQSDKRVYLTFKINPYDFVVMMSIEYNLIHQAINLLFGGKIDTGAYPLASPGKVGMIVAEKLSESIMECFQKASSEHDQFEAEHLKKSISVTRINTLPDDEKMHLIDFNIVFDDNETSAIMIVTEEMLAKFFPVDLNSSKHREKDFWRTAIKKEVIDSYVTVTVNLPDVGIKLNHFMSLKEGDEIPISDPTAVYVCLNSLKLFRAIAGQSNSKLIARIENQI